MRSPIERRLEREALLATFIVGGYLLWQGLHWLLR